MPRTIELPDDPAAALHILRTASAEGPIVVFKASPTCPISHKAQWEFKNYLKGLADDDPLITVTIDVLDRRSLARGLTSALQIEHQSPQALWFEAGELSWHDSNGNLTATYFGAKRG